MESNALSQMEPSLPTTFRSISILSFHLRLDLSSCRFPSDFLYNPVIFSWRSCPNQA